MPDAAAIRAVQPTRSRPITVLSYGVGIDSTAMLIELHARGEAPDLVLTADTEAENPVTYAFLSFMQKWMDERGIAHAVVRHEVKRLGKHPPYHGLFQSLLVNACLPSIAFGFHTCSQKHKISPQDAYIRAWPPAAAAMAAGQPIVRLVGLDAGPRDSQRYAHAATITRKDFDTRYPLRDWLWDRERCTQRIIDAGITPPPKSSCGFCLGMKPEELRALPAFWHHRIVLLEARAQHRLRTIEGLWRRSTKSRPGSMTTFLEAEGLVSPSLAAWIKSHALASLDQFLTDAAATEPANREPLDTWIAWFDSAAKARA